MDATLAALAAIGLAAGFLSTLLGIGGGLVVVPLLAYGLGVDFVAATAVSLVAMAIQTPAGLWTHHRRGAVDWRIGGWLALGGLAGVAAGHLVQPGVPEPALKLAFAAVLAAAAWRLWVRLAAAGPGKVPWPALVTLGVAAGFLSRMLGIGGGLVSVPVLILLGVPVHAAVASSLVAVATNALVASAWIVAGGGVDLRVALPVAVAALVAAPLGTWVAHALDAARLRRTFAVALVVAAALIAAEALRSL